MKKTLSLACSLLLIQCLFWIQQNPVMYLLTVDESCRDWGRTVTVEQNNLGN